MQQYRVEFFENVTGTGNSHSLKYRHHDFSENLTIDDDYLAIQTTVIEIGATDKIQTGQLIRILRDDQDYFFGVVVDVAPGEHTTKVSFKPFIAIFDTDVLFDTDDQLYNNEEHSLENVLKKYIENDFVSNSDSYQNYPIDVFVPASGQHTVNWGMNIKSDVEGAHHAVIGLYGVLIVNALKKFGVAINVKPKFSTGRIELSIGTVSGLKYIDADLDNVEITTLKVNDRPDGLNKLVVYNTDNFNQQYTFYAHPDHTWDRTNSDRITPVARNIRTATPDYELDVDDPFLIAAVNVAYDELSGLTWDNLIEFECAPNDPLVNPVAMEIGQEVSIFYNGNTYTSILTGKNVTFETVTLTFGSERIKFTKKRTSK